MTSGETRADGQGAPAKASSLPVRIEWIPSSESAVAQEKWLHLEQEIGNNALKSSWPWIATWRRHFGDTVPHSFALGQQGNRTIGAALIAQLNYLFVPILVIGTPDEFPRERTHPHYNCLLVNDDHLASFAGELMKEIKQRRWSVLRIEGMVADHAAALVRAGSSSGLHVITTMQPTYSFDFKAVAEGEDVLTAFSHDTRHKVRRSIRAFAQAFGPQQLEWAESSAEARDIFEELMNLHSQRWRERRETGAFNTNRLKAYHRDLIDALFPNRLIVFRVKYGHTTIGCLYNFVEEDGHITNHRSGFRYFPDNKLKPGYVTNVLFMEEARKRGYSEFDLLSGHEGYKKLITNTEHDLVQAFVYLGPRSLAYRAARALYREPRLRRRIRQVITLLKPTRAR